MRQMGRAVSTVMPVAATKDSMTQGGRRPRVHAGRL